MNDKVTELGEWVAQELYRLWREAMLLYGVLNATHVPELFTDIPKCSQATWRDQAKQILSHPDLALIKGKMEVPVCCSECQCQNIFHVINEVIPLVEALKER